jgi:heme/copper-type cytochrome/quinol oxidase subunit 4
MSESEHPVDLNRYLRRCALVFVAILCATGLMIFTSYLPHTGWPAKVAMILAVAAVNAFVVAGFLMHLLAEKKTIYLILGFTVFFFAGLMALTLWAMAGFPPGTATH